QIQRLRGRGAENATTDAERAFGLRLPTHERELLRLSREIDAIRERHNSSWRGGSPQREHSVAHSDVLRRGRLLIGSGIKNHLAGPCRRTYVIGAVVALYLNAFVLTAQLFAKIPALKSLAPTQSEPAFLGMQVVIMLIFIPLGVLPVKRFRAEAIQVA